MGNVSLKVPGKLLNIWSQKGLLIVILCLFLFLFFLLQKPTFGVLFKNDHEAFRSKKIILSFFFF